MSDWVEVTSGRKKNKDKQAAGAQGHPASPPAKPQQAQAAAPPLAPATPSTSCWEPRFRRLLASDLPLEVRTRPLPAKPSVAIAGAAGPGRAEVVAGFGSGPEGGYVTAVDLTLNSNTVLARFRLPRPADGPLETIGLLLGAPEFCVGLKESFNSRWGPSQRAFRPRSARLKAALTSVGLIAHLADMLTASHGFSSFYSKQLPAASAGTLVEDFLAAIYGLQPLSAWRAPPSRRPSTAAPASPAARLPPDVLRHLLSFLDPTSLALAGRVCAAWHTAARTPALWTALARRYPVLPARVLVPAAARAYLLEAEGFFAEPAQGQRKFFDGFGNDSVLLVARPGDVVALLTNGSD